jgi:hypothetical protein
MRALFSGYFDLLIPAELKMRFSLRRGHLLVASKVVCANASRIPRRDPLSVVFRESDDRG